MYVSYCLQIVFLHSQTTCLKKKQLSRDNSRILPLLGQQTIKLFYLSIGACKNYLYDMNKYFNMTIIVENSLFNFNLIVFMVHLQTNLPFKALPNKEKKILNKNKLAIRYYLTIKFQ